jgi:folate/biopterin transporter
VPLINHRQILRPSSIPSRNWKIPQQQHRQHTTALCGQPHPESSSQVTAAEAAAVYNSIIKANKSKNNNATTTTIRFNNTTATASNNAVAMTTKPEDPTTAVVVSHPHPHHHPVQAWFEKHVLLGMDATPETLAIVTIYFVEGALGLARLAQSYLLKDELQLGPAELSAVTGLFVLPWTIKPVYGFLSDGFPLFGYQRKSYLIAAGLLGGISYGVLGITGLWEGIPAATATSGTVVALLVSSACIAFSDVVADGIVVTRTRQAKDDPAVAGGLQSLCWGAAALGGLLSFSGSLLEVMSVRSIFGITAVLPFLVALIAVGMDEKPVVKNPDNDNTLIEGVKEQVDTLWGALRQPSIWKPALFIFLWQSTPTTDGAFFFFLTNDLQFGPEFLGRVRLVTAGAGLVGVWLYNQYFKTVKIKDILFWSTLASFPLGMLPVLLITHVNRDFGIPDSALIYGDDVALAALGQISFMPTLVLAARLCPPGVEAVLFATLMSIFNGAGTVGTEIGALMTKWAGITDSNFDNLAWLTIICNITSLWPLIFIGWLDEVGVLSEAEIEADDGSVDNDSPSDE